MVIIGTFAKIIGSGLRLHWLGKRSGACGDGVWVILA